MEGGGSLLEERRWGFPGSFPEATIVPSPSQAVLCPRLLVTEVTPEAASL